MVAAIVITVLATLHIISAISWLGASIFFVLILGPGFRTLTPPTTVEFFMKIGSKAPRYFTAFASATILFGLLLLYAVTNGDFSVLWTTNFGTTISIGLTLGLVAYLDAMLITAPKFSKGAKLAAEMMKNPPQGPPTEFIATLKKGGQSALIGTIILVIAAIFMVTSAFPF